MVGLFCFESAGKSRLGRHGLVNFSGIKKLSDNCSASTGPEFKLNNQPLEEDKGGSRRETLMTKFKETEQ